MEQPIFLIDDAGTKSLAYGGAKPTTNTEAKAISLRKFEIILSFLERRIVITVFARGTCGYCMLHWNGDCTECPVRLRTGARWCEDSPYEEYDRAKRRYSWALSSSDDDDEDDDNHREELIDDMIIAVKKEIEFLKSLPD